MMNVLRQSTTATVKLGPFLDDTDGKTAETALTIAQADVRLSKNGGNMAQKNEATSATHDELGYYDVPLDATDTATCGTLRVMVSESGALPVFRDFQVVEEAVYDALFAASAVGPLLASATGSTLTAIPWNASWDTEVQSECADALTAYDPPTKAELDTAVSGLATAAALATVDGIVDDILVDTAVIGAAGAGLTAVPWNASWDAEVQSECADAITASSVLKASTAYDITTVNGVLETTFVP